MNDAELARNYILDRLSEEDREACERRFLFDSEFELVMLEQEHALLDDYVNLRLSDEDSQTVLRRVAQEPGRLYRLRFAEGLKLAAAVAAETNAFEADRAPRRLILFRRHQLAWFGGLAGAAALAALIFAAMHIEHHAIAPSRQAASSALPQPALSGGHGTPRIPASSSASTHAGSAKTESQHRSAPSSMATFVLLADESRGEAGSTAIPLKQNVDLVRLQLTSQEGLDPGHYSATVRDAGGRVIFQAAHMLAQTEAGRRYIDLRIPAVALGAGDYTIDLARDAPGTPALSFRFRGMPDAGTG